MMIKIAVIVALFACASANDVKGLKSPPGKKGLYMPPSRRAVAYPAKDGQNIKSTLDHVVLDNHQQQQQQPQQYEIKGHNDGLKSETKRSIIQKPSTQHFIADEQIPVQYQQTIKAPVQQQQQDVKGYKAPVQQQQQDVKGYKDSVQQQQHEPQQDEQQQQVVHEFAIGRRPATTLLRTPTGFVRSPGLAAYPII